MGDQHHPGQGGTVSFHKSSLATVIFGCKVPPAVLRAVAIVLNEYGYSHTGLESRVRLPHTEP
jgi:hypothetical protein